MGKGIEMKLKLRCFMTRKAFPEKGEREMVTDNLASCSLFSVLQHNSRW